MALPSAPWLLVAAVVAANLACWAAFRVDKAAAAARSWRISERTLLILTTLGGLGALLGMFAHRQRHKTRKLRFLLWAPLATAAQAAALVAYFTR